MTPRNIAPAPAPDGRHRTVADNREERLQRPACEGSYRDDAFFFENYFADSDFRRIFVRS
jgi:hypothetical protein